MLAGRWAAPVPDPAARGGLQIAPAPASEPLVIDLPPGALHLERISADLSRFGQPPGWIRLTPYDLDQMGLDALAATMGEADRSTRPAGGRPVVVECADSRQARRFLSRLAAVHPTEPQPAAVILHYVQPNRKRGSGIPAWQPVRAGGPDGARPGGGALGDGTLDDLVLELLTGGRLALYDSVLAAGRWLRPGELASIVGHSGSADELTARVAGRLLRDMPPGTVALLGFAAVLGYGHRRFGSIEPLLDACGGCPWWTDLMGGWQRFEPAWRPGVLSVCRGELPRHVPLLGRLVAELVDDGAAGAAIELCLDAGFPGVAGDLLAGIGPELVSAGRPRSVQRWLRRLPWAVRRRHRELAGQARATRRRPGGVVAGRGWIAVRPAARNRPDIKPSGAPGASPPALQAGLLGPVCVSIGGREVRHWHGRKGVLLLAYLLLHRHGGPIRRDALAVTFWPDASPEASRNRLHVAVHALRADLQTASPAPVVLFDEGYRINADLAVRLDAEVFEQAVARGRRAEQGNDPGAALDAYREAAREYRGDLLSDYPYEDWTLLPREHYRVRLLDALGRAAQLAFDLGRYPESMESGQRLLALDFCREDVHRLLMRAHARLGRPHLAVHQFEICARQLRRELNMAPAPETVDLLGRIRARSTV